MGLLWWGPQTRDWVLQASLGELVTGVGGNGPVCDGQCAWGSRCCVVAADSFHKTAAIQQIASSNCIFKRQSINGCLTEVGNFTRFSNHIFVPNLGSLGSVLPACLRSKRAIICVCCKASLCMWQWTKGRRWPSVCLLFPCILQVPSGDIW